MIKFIVFIILYNVKYYQAFCIKIVFYNTVYTFFKVFAFKAMNPINKTNASSFISVSKLSVKKLKVLNEFIDFLWKNFEGILQLSIHLVISHKNIFLNFALAKYLLNHNLFQLSCL